MDERARIRNKTTTFPHIRRNTGYKTGTAACCEHSSILIRLITAENKIPSSRFVNGIDVLKFINHRKRRMNPHEP